MDRFSQIKKWFQDGTLEDKDIEWLIQELGKYQKHAPKLELLESKQGVLVPLATYNHDTELSQNQKAELEEVKKQLKDLQNELMGCSVNSREVIEQILVNHQEELRLSKFEMTEEEVCMELKGEPALYFMNTLVQFFQDNQAENFMTMTLENKDKKFSISIEDCTGTLSIAEKMHQMEQT